ncbi:MAG: nucleotidyltransferase domain-containing protein [Burkholderiaceae bacterium]
MRLDPKIQELIKKEVSDQLGSDVVIRLFGSRVDDAEKGGDIDLLIETRRTLENRFEVESRLATKLYIRLGGRKVDVLLKDESTQVQSIHTQAIKTGIVL